MARPKVTIIDGNNEIELSTIEDNVKAFMVKGEPGTNGVSPTIETSRTGKVTTITIEDAEGTKEADINDGFDPTATVTKANRIATVTITDINGTTTTEIHDGIDLTGGVPTNGVIGFDVTELIYTCDGTETGTYYFTYDNISYYFTMPTVEDGDILVFNVDDLELSLDGTTITTSSTGTGTELTFIDNIPNGYEETDESLGGADIPQQDTAPANPKENDLWIDTDENGLTVVDSAVSTTSTNPVENQAITNYVNGLTTPVSYTLTDTPAHSGGTNSQYIYKIGNIVIMNFNLWTNSTTAYSWTEIGTLPNDIIPSGNIFALGSCVSGSNGNLVGEFLIDINNGNLRAKPNVTQSGLTGYRANITYVL